MILNIDERRGKFLQFFSFIFVGVLSIFVTLMNNTGVPCLSEAIFFTVLLFSTFLTGLAFMWALCSERKANIRYRKWINLIREIFLGTVENPKTSEEFIDSELRKYLTMKDWGIKTSGDNIDKIGGTLTGIFICMAIELLTLQAAIVYIWWPFLPSNTCIRQLILVTMFFIDVLLSITFLILNRNGKTKRNNESG